VEVRLSHVKRVEEPAVTPNQRNVTPLLTLDVAAVAPLDKVRVCLARLWLREAPLLDPERRETLGGEVRTALREDGGLHNDWARVEAVAERPGPGIVSALLIDVGGLFPTDVPDEDLGALLAPIGEQCVQICRDAPARGDVTTDRFATH